MPYIFYMLLFRSAPLYYLRNFSFYISYLSLSFHIDIDILLQLNFVIIPRKYSIIFSILFDRFYQDDRHAFLTFRVQICWVLRIGIRGTPIASGQGIVNNFGVHKMQINVCIVDNKFTSYILSSVFASCIQ